MTSSCDEQNGARRVRPRVGSLAAYGDRQLHILNEIHLGAQLTVAALADLRQRMNDRGDSGYHHFEVPTGSGGSGRIRRNPKGLNVMLDGLFKEGEYRKSLMLMVSSTEDYVQEVLRIILTAYPRNLAHGPNGGTADVRVPLTDLLDGGLDQTLAQLVRDRLRQVLYASPEDYLDYLGSLLRVRLQRSTIDAFTEMKASRDVVVHGNGISDNTYVKKADSLARVEAGRPLPIDRPYFDRCLTTAKELVEEIQTKLCAKYGDDTAILQVLAARRADD